MKIEQSSSSECYLMIRSAICTKFSLSVASMRS